MKTAEECVIGLMQLAGSNPKDLERLKKTPQFRQSCDYFAGVQLDAYKAGMTRAADVVQKEGTIRSIDNTRDVLDTRSKRIMLDILTTRDSLTELPL